MLYPIITYSDGTEVTASGPDSSGDVFLFIEKFDKEKDSFNFVKIQLTAMKIVDSKGFTNEELTEMLDKYSRMKADIIEYVYEKVKHIINRDCRRNKLA